MSDANSDPMPWEDVEASRRNHGLQRRHRIDQAKETYLLEARSCPSCHTAPSALSWFYFRSPEGTWPAECGCAGWMTVCDSCRLQVNFFIEVMS
jgi:hypothetical protein